MARDAYVAQRALSAAAQAATKKRLATSRAWCGKDQPLVTVRASKTQGLEKLPANVLIWSA
jgi:hypothetical protein